MPRLAIVGMGKMGRTVDQLAQERGWQVVARIDASGEFAHEITAASLAGADVAIEFTAPAAAVANIRALVDAGCPVVCGTTGWDAERQRVESFVRDRNGALLAAPNFSLGVAAFRQIVAAAGRAMRQAAGFEAHMVETHHSAKKDAPSGTAVALAAELRATLGRDVPVTSVRVGAVPGTHEIIFDAPFEQVRLEHVARDRRVFADGALRAADWLIGRHGIFTLQDMLAPSTESTT